MRRRFMIAAVVVLATGAAVSARGDIQIQAGTVNANLSQSTHSQPVDGVAAYAIQQFDPTYGTLDAVTVSFSNLQVSAASWLRIDNESQYPVVLTGALSAQLSVSAGLSESSAVTRTGNGSATYTFYQDSDAAPDFLGSDSGNMGLYSANGFGTLTKHVEQAAFSNYTGTGYALIGLHAAVSPILTVVPSGLPPLTAPPAYRFINGVQVTGTFTVTYEYTPFAAAPEPSTFAMCGIAALLGLGHGWWCRRRTAV